MAVWSQAKSQVFTWGGVFGFLKGSGESGLGFPNRTDGDKRLLPGELGSSSEDGSSESDSEDFLRIVKGRIGWLMLGIQR